MMKRTFPASFPPLSRLAHLIVLILGTSSVVHDAIASETSPAPHNPPGEVITSSGDVMTFDPIFLSKDAARQVDLTRFERGANAIPGDYAADIYVNNEHTISGTVSFREQPDKSVALCLTPGVIKQLGLNYSKLSSDAREQLKNDDNGCLSLTRLLPQATSSWDSGTQRLDVSVPQIFVQSNSRGYVSPELWDSGIPAAMLGYTSNFYTNRARGQETDSGYVGINGGLNLGGWYFRHNGNYSWQNGGGQHYQTLNTYVQRDIPRIGGRLILGEYNTSGQLFDSLPFRGAELVDDERMRPQSERGFAPVVRGIARTNARVTVRQNGQVIYQTTVSPGAFELTDLYPTGYGGDLDVTVAEADGTLQTFAVPYASVSQLLRPGSSHYNVVVGQLNDTSLSSHPELYQLTYQRGLSNLLTGYGGLQLSQNYSAVQLGTALNTVLGALALDATQTRASLGDDNWEQDGLGSTMSGQSYRVSFSKYFNETSSDMSIAAYRFSTSGYMDFRTAMQTRDVIEHGGNPSNIYRPKDKMVVTANQGLPSGWGQFYASGYVQDYWNNNTHTDVQYQMGYSNFFHSVSWSINAGRSRNGEGQMENTFLLNLSMPLGISGQSDVPQFNASVSRDSNGSLGEQAGISGSAGEDRQLSYGFSGTHYNNGSGSSATVNGQYRNPYTNLSASGSVGKGYQSASAGLSGTVIGFGNGVVFTPYTGDTFAIVDATGASGARVGNYTGVKVDPWGHAAIPYLSPYEMNEVDLDPRGLPYDVELENTSQKVAPLSGAVVRLRFSTQHGYPILIASHTPAGTPIPFGAEVHDSKGNSVGMAGQGGVIYARVQYLHDQLKVAWGKGAHQQCQVNYQLPPQSEKATTAKMSRFNTVCQ